MATGIDKWFNDAKGFGFITPDASGTDVLIQFSAISMDTYKMLKQDSCLSFDLTNGPKGLYAQNITVTEAPMEATANEAPQQKSEPRTRTLPCNVGHAEHTHR